MQCPLFLVRLHPSQQRPQKESERQQIKIAQERNCKRCILQLHLHLVI